MYIKVFIEYYKNLDFMKLTSGRVTEPITADEDVTE